MYDLIIIGSGPAGLTAGIYGQRAQLETLLLEKGYVSGGQVMNTYEVDNYPGLPGVSGMELSEKLQNHGEKLGLKIQQGEVTSIEKKENNFVINASGETYETRGIIIATGARHRLLGVPGEEKLAGMGVSYCATCDGAFFANQTVAVIGGGDVALEDALLLARGCEKVYLIHRRDAFRGTPVLQEAVRNTDNIEIIWNTVVEEIQGEEQLESLLLSHVKTGAKTQLQVQGAFVAVGTLPNSEAFLELVDTDERNYIIAGENCATNVPGIFAAGDVRTKELRQIITAAADGACAVASLEKYFLEK